jgi:four helix bundle protein
MGGLAERYTDLDVYHKAMEAAMEIFQATKSFPKEERYSLVDQMRRSSRSVCANIAEAWRKRRYKAAFVARLCEAESEACETQVWLQFALRCDYLDSRTHGHLETTYSQILGKLVRMIKEAEQWLIAKQ